MNLRQYKEKIKEPLKTDKELKRVEIIILKYKTIKAEIDCITKIIKHTRHPYKLNLFDTKDLTGNMSKMWNKLVKESTCDYVLIMDTDAFVHYAEVDWLTELMRVFELKEKNIGVVVPVSKFGINSRQIRNREPTGSAFEIIDSGFSGYCFLFKKEMFEEIGSFDEDFYIFGQDSEWSTRISESPKWRIFCQPRVEITHGYETDLGGSLSTKKASEEGEFNWELDIAWAKKLAMEKIEYRHRLRNRKKDQIIKENDYFKDITKL